MGFNGRERSHGGCKPHKEDCTMQKRDMYANPTSPLNRWAYFPLINYPNFSMPFKQFLKHIVQFECVV